MAAWLSVTGIDGLSDAVWYSKDDMCQVDVGLHDVMCVRLS
jgi:hypothetical protein